MLGVRRRRACGIHPLRTPMRRSFQHTLCIHAVIGIACRPYRKPKLAAELVESPAVEKVMTQYEEEAAVDTPQQKGRGGPKTRQQRRQAIADAADTAPAASGCVTGRLHRPLPSCGCCISPVHCTQLLHCKEHANLHRTTLLRMQPACRLTPPYVLNAHAGSCCCPPQAQALQGGD
jgi:hypothetical protein